MIKNTLFVMGFCLLLSACGYHLKGTGSSVGHLVKIHVSGTVSQEFINALKQVYQNVPDRIVKDEQQAELNIQVLNERYSRRTISLNSMGYSNEYELNYRVNFNVLTPQGKMKLKNESVVVHKNYYNDQTSDSLISKQQEELRLRHALYVNAVQYVISRATAQTLNN